MSLIWPCCNLFPSYTRDWDLQSNRQLNTNPFLGIAIMARPRSTILPLHGGSFHPDFDDSGFSRCEAVSGLAPTNLTYPVHTFFSRCNFQALGIVLDKSQLSLRLATAFMVAGLPVFHATLCGNAEQIEGTDERGQPFYKFPNPLGKPTEDQKVLAGSCSIRMPGRRPSI